MNGSPARLAASAAIAVATILVIAGVVVALFFNPVYVAFEQDRSQAAAWTGFNPAQLHSATNQVLGELYFGPGTFTMSVDGAPLFDPRERQHIADVRGVFSGFGLAALAGLAVLLTAAATVRGRAWFWRAVAGGSMALAAAVVGVGFVFAVAFDAAFDVFHKLFFAGGSYTFDPRTERLVQLFPEQFWSETSVALAIAGLVAALLVARAARGRSRALEARERQTAERNATAEDQVRAGAPAVSGERV